MPWILRNVYAPEGASAFLQRLETQNKTVPCMQLTGNMTNGHQDVH